MMKYSFKTKRRKHFKKAPCRFDVDKLREEAIREEFEIKIGGAFEPLLDTEITLEDLYRKYVSATNATTKEVVGMRRRKSVECMAAETADLCEKRRAARIKMLKDPTNPDVR